MKTEAGTFDEVGRLELERRAKKDGNEIFVGRTKNIIFVVKITRIAVDFVSTSDMHKNGAFFSSARHSLWIASDSLIDYVGTNGIKVIW